MLHHGGRRRQLPRPHTDADNIDLRCANRFIDLGRELIFGLSLNDKPSSADPCNTAAACCAS
jgi:hypothetical protein